MARLSDLLLKHQIFVRGYPFRRLEPIPWCAPRRPLSGARLALVTTAGFYAPGMEPFDENARGGDPSFRVLGTRDAGDQPAAGLRKLQIGHRSTAFDATGIASDYNLALPVAVCLALEREGKLGRLHEEALSFSGSITAPGRLGRDTAPEAARRLLQAGVDIAFLTPV